MIAPKLPSVLIVEDEGIIAQNLRELLLSLGYDTFAVAATSERAVACASERCPDVVLMDIRIKGKLDGIATAELLKERFDVPIIYLTAHADEATIQRAKKTEPFGYLMKPVKPAELRSAIEIALYKHAMDRRLRVRERWFSTTVRSIADAVIMVDLAGKVTFMNPVAESLLGLPLSETLGRPARDVLRLREAEWPRGETPLDRALRERQPVEMREAVLEGAGGSGTVIADSAAPVIDEDEMLGAVMVFRDVTEQKRLQQQLEIADRLASLGTMAAGVAHEINNPLSVVIGNAEFVQEHLTHALSQIVPGAIGAEASELALKDAIELQGELLSAASRMVRIVSDLLAFSRPRPERPGSVDVRDPIEWAIRSTEHEFRYRARLSTKLHKVPQVDADETKLGQILVNLLINAAHAIAPGNADANEISIATGIDDDGRVVIEVRDTGIGMAPDVLRRIFEPFFTTKPMGVGTGLGLSICHGLVTAMNGELSVTSRVDAGTTFKLKLPASVRAAASSVSPPAPVDVIRRGRLLVVDDDDMVLKSLSRMLSDHEVVSMTTAREALERLKVDDRFDIIFSDLMMPNMTGMDFYEALLRLRPELATRVIFLSGAAGTPKIARFLEAVPNLSISKPFGLEKLRSLVQQVLASRAQVRSPE